MTITVDLASNVPIYQQIKSAIVEAISAGKLQEGDSLPSVRQLANDVGVNMLTINKVYTILKQEGYITINKRSGALVSRRPAADQAFLKTIRSQIRKTAVQARSRSVSESEFMQICSNVYQELDRETVK